MVTFSGTTNGSYVVDNWATSKTITTTPFNNDQFSVQIEYNTSNIQLIPGSTCATQVPVDSASWTLGPIPCVGSACTSEFSVGAQIHSMSTERLELQNEPGLFQLGFAPSPASNNLFVGFTANPGLSLVNPFGTYSVAYESGNNVGSTFYGSDNVNLHLAVNSATNDAAVATFAHAADPVSSAPEPETATLFGLPVLALALWRIRKQSV